MIVSIELDEARRDGATHYFTGKMCKNGHIASRRVSTRECVECGLEKNRRFYAANREHFLTLQRARQAANRDSCRKSATNWKRNNTERVAEYRKAYTEANKEKLAEQSRIWRSSRLEHCKNRHRDWVRANMGRWRHFQALRKLAKTNATPDWLTESQKEEISEFYVKSRRLTEITGVRHEVDHIVPIRGKTVCGLHVPWNLRVTTKSENSSKNNKLIETLVLADGEQQAEDRKVAAKKVSQNPNPNPQP